MTFIKFARFDIEHGVLMRWRQLLLTVLFSFLAGLLHLLSLRVYELVHPDYLELRPLMGDFLLTIFGGCSANAIQETGVNFQVPFLWLAYVCWMLFLVLRYPLEELNGMGKHQLILSGQRSAWWFSKCIWVGAETTASFLAVCLGACLAGVPVRAKCSLGVNSYLFAELSLSQTGLNPPPWNLFGLLAANLCVLIALGMAQMLLSLYLKPMYAYLIVVAYLLLSTYFDHPLFLGNYLMAARSSCLLQTGYDYVTGCLVGLWLAVVIAILGWCCFENYDILGRDEP